MSHPGCHAANTANAHIVWCLSLLTGRKKKRSFRKHSILNANYFAPCPGGVSLSSLILNLVSTVVNLAPETDPLEITLFVRVCLKDKRRLCSCLAQQNAAVPGLSPT